MFFEWVNTSYDTSSDIVPQVSEALIMYYNTNTPFSPQIINLQLVRQLFLHSARQSLPAGLNKLNYLLYGHLQLSTSITLTIYHLSAVLSYLKSLMKKNLNSKYFSIFIFSVKIRPPLWPSPTQGNMIWTRICITWVCFNTSFSFIDKLVFEKISKIFCIHS